MTIDVLGVLDISNRSLMRRAMHMYNRTSLLTNEPILDPYAEKMNQILTQDELITLKNMVSKMPVEHDMKTFTRFNTSSLGLSDLENSDRDAFMKIYQDLKPRVEKILGKTVYEFNSNTFGFYTYWGDTSQHDWHVDPDNNSSLFPIIICVEKKGDISPFQWLDAKKQQHSIYTEEGDGIIFKGGTTIHRVPMNNDPNSVRRVMSIKFKTDKCHKEEENNMCGFVQGGKYKSRIAIVILIFILVAFVADYFSNIEKKVTNRQCLGLLLIACLYSRIVPTIIDTGLGTGRPVQMTHHIVWAVSLIIVTFSIRRGSLLYSYLILSDQMFKRSMMKY